MSDPRKKGGKDDKTKKGKTRFVKVLKLCVCRTKLHLHVNCSMKSLLQKKSLTQQKVPLKMVLFVILVYLCFDNSSIPISEKCTRSTLQRKLVFVDFFFLGTISTAVSSAVSVPFQKGGVEHKLFSPNIGWEARLFLSVLLVLLLL